MLDVRGVLKYIVCLSPSVQTFNELLGALIQLDDPLRQWRKGRRQGMYCKSDDRKNQTQIEIMSTLRR